VLISTYALCGFSNFGSIGIQLGALGAMAPSRRNDLAKLALKAMIAGNIACFMTACIAGMLSTTVNGLNKIIFTQQNTIVTSIVQH
jgi:concentrative nucleoside transporter, CNT family